MSNPRIVITAFITAKPGLEAALRARVQQLVADTVREPGCIEFQVFEERDVPGRFVLWEIFADEAAFRAHLDMGYTRDYFASGLIERTQGMRLQPF